MESNTAALCVILAVWMYRGMRGNLALLIVGYYIVYMLAEVTNLAGIFPVPESEAMGIYAIQVSVDTIFIMLCMTLSSFYQKFVKLYSLYATIIGTSLLLNGLMLYAEMLNLSWLYGLHAIRQELSIPLDVTFAVLGSAHGKEFTTVGRSLRAASRSVYNRLNRFCNYI